MGKGARLLCGEKSFRWGELASLRAEWGREGRKGKRKGEVSLSGDLSKTDACYLLERKSASTDRKGEKEKKDFIHHLPRRGGPRMSFSFDEGVT